MPVNLKMLPKGIGSRDNIHEMEKSSEKPVANVKTPSATTYIVVWIALSSAVILHNKYILSAQQFTFPMLLTSWHLIFATIMTQILARTSYLKPSLQNIKMTSRDYATKVMPIAVFFSLSLIMSNKAYLYLSVSFIQMLKAFTPIAVLFASAITGVAKFEWKTFTSIAVIVFGITLTTVGELEFVPLGVLLQVLGICFEASRLVLVQKLLKDMKMDALASLYYFAPACGGMNFIAFLLFEYQDFEISDLNRVGLPAFIVNASVAFTLNLAVVLLIRKTSSLVVTLSGVVKDILLVVLSMVLFGNPVTPLQFFGYSVALIGLVAYKSGGFPTTVAAYQDLSKQYLNRNRLMMISFIITCIVYCLVSDGMLGDGDEEDTEGLANTPNLDNENAQQI